MGLHHNVCSYAHIRVIFLADMITSTRWLLLCRIRRNWANLKFHRTNKYFRSDWKIFRVEYWEYICCFTTTKAYKYWLLIVCFPFLIWKFKYRATIKSELNLLLIHLEIRHAKQPKITNIIWGAFVRKLSFLSLIILCMDLNEILDILTDLYTVKLCSAIK